MKYVLAWIISFSLLACGQRTAIDDITNIPEVSPADSVYKNVYQSLHGLWVGDFEIYLDESGAPRDEALLYQLTPSVLNRPELRSVDVIRVHQRYESLTPFFQRVDIEDTYRDGRVVVSSGVNKVQDGKMWCVVHKPDETVIHEGSTKGPETIIWQRHETSPQKIEYFQETVSDNRYTIIGWGYYEGDDTSRMPRYWYHGLYRRDY
ncbi:hypothetical protein [Flavilitoribacter nigricans]|uniref:Uncharacterized protein n=1 Tax=Flavilitoribacter nigricans (strain ATCC 23147 / DSM 23189 / NBRC 102662 / NCIMB 1420 / SS-2) TaxID=1122177 RepID=A0A2D0N3H5_FLAN2|nr:hypothetical protein [Flavilitoribacter nigricans]PHN03092.1 hypothetical protein CRP01_28855 [Flavilitoribacter nigricans DSM 23189 = NBRC 102662]